MQQRGFNTTMENENIDEPKSPPPSSSSSTRGRHNSKLKVLVRSHAMREETSPPREPSPNHMTNLIALSPTTTMTTTTTTTIQCNRMISSLQLSPVNTNPMVVLSPYLSRGNSPCRSPVCSSPTSTLVPSPNNSRCSPQSASPQHSIIDNNERLNSSSDTETITCSSPKYLNRFNKQTNMEKDIRRDTTITSHLNSNSNNNNIIINNNKTRICDCQSQYCSKCVKAQERNNNSTNTNNNNNNVVVVGGSNNTLTVSRVNSRGKLRQQSSSQGSFEGSSSNSPCLSRDSSSEYTDNSGIDLEVFIPDTLNRSARDRALMLRIEKELVILAKDECTTHYKFAPMSSYQRMLVHRCAAYFGMDHNIESTGKCVVVNKTRNTRIPDIEFKEHIKEDIIFNDEPRRSILKRDSNSIEDYNFKSPDRQNSIENRRSKSFEEREEEYAKVRRRIFNHKSSYFIRQMNDESLMDDFEWPEIRWSSTDSDIHSRYKLQPPEQHHRKHFGKLIKVQSEEMSETLRPCVAKSYSFGGYAGVLNRGDSVISTHSAGPRLLTKQDSAASSVSYRLSPSSSGYKSQSLLSESVTPSPTSTPHPITEENNQQDSNGSSDNNSPDKDSGDTPIIWAVTNMQRVPKGSIIIDPQTGQKLRNNDGSVYHYDPNNPPPIYVAATKPPLSPKKTTQCSPQKSNNNSSIIKEQPQSPKKRARASPIHKSHVTNSSTSPGLPYSPPIQQQQQSPQMTNRNFTQFLNDNLPPPPPQQQQQYQPVYGNGYATQTTCHDGSVQMYQQPCFIYTTQYGVPHFDARLEPQQIPDVTGSYFITDNSATPAAQTVTYQQQPAYWNQQTVPYYQMPPNSTPSQRFTIPLHGGQGQTGYIPSYPQNYLPPTNPEVLPIYTNQPVQMVYQSPPPPPPQPPTNQQNTILYPTNQPNIIYTQNPLYTNQTVYTQQNLPQYPQNTSTPNSCSSLTTQHTNLQGQIQEHSNFIHLTQNMAQMSITSSSSQGQICSPNQNYLSNNNSNSNKTHYDNKQKNYNSTRGNKFNTGKNFLINSSQSSTGTNSPATTVVAGYCPSNYKTPPETPPTQFSYGPNFSMPPPPVLIRQMSNVRASTPGTARSSRSPTPASDISHFERQKISLPTQLYQGMHYVFPCRGQHTGYRQQAPLRHQNFDNRPHRGRRTKTNKTTNNLPPNGKPL